jgi:polyphosphate kinase
MAEHLALLDFGSNAVRFMYARLLPLLERVKCLAIVSSNRRVSSWCAWRICGASCPMGAATRAQLVCMVTLDCSPQIGEDLTEVFNSITGYMRPRPLHHLLMAPLGLREAFATRVRREAENARTGLPARIILKMNSLVDPVRIEELYAAAARAWRSR